ncbi:Ivy family c-type lysozyme inhibitor [Ancylobacter amanitiformis]|uniref:Inhibitor of vertebrate lysozyme n=1 Tax=Ancylobacter amanitiformis TaxID=217069 RepID=A0ABU0LP48_9HYPH|nr:Ivy family c-type lysozyme inhibitor [Ancylobacter amanitiformis]MDQ0510473.1 hypothetical protein [Ancylobacter amanitiformis]
MRAVLTGLAVLVLLGAAPMLASPARAATSAVTTQGKFALYEVIGHDPYRGAWKKLTAPVIKSERWLKGGHGIWSPAQIVQVDAQRFKVFLLCKVNECASTRISVIFAPDGTRAYGALRTSAGTQVLGSPNVVMHKALLKALQE